MTRISGSSRPARQRGFTLLEILLVVGIIGMLASIVAVNVRSHQDKTKIRITEVNLKSLKTAVTTFEMDLLRLPKNLHELTIEGDADWPGPYLEDETVPTDGGGNDFKMVQEGKRVKIKSAGPDGRFGTDDDLSS